MARKSTGMTVAAVAYKARDAEVSAVCPGGSVARLFMAARISPDVPRAGQQGGDRIVGPGRTVGFAAPQRGTA